MTTTSQTRILVATAIALAAIDIAVRLLPTTRSATPLTGDVVTAREFRLVDQWGHQRATMSLDGNGEPGIMLFDRNGTVRAQLDTWENTPSLILFDKDGERRTYYGMDNDSGSPIFDMYNGGRTNTPFATISPNAPRVLMSAPDCTTTLSFQSGFIAHNR